MKYVFILGHNPELSTAEIFAVLPAARLVKQTKQFLVVESQNFDCQAMMRRLGGTVKIGIIMTDKISKNLIVNDILSRKPEGKVRFGISEYGKSKIKNQKSKLQIKNLKFGLDIKRLLKENGVSSRLVTSREPVLSSVVITKNKCQEYMILDDLWLAKTCAVQEFEEYSFRDYGRPARDVLSGTMPPKLAKIMINLVPVSLDAQILDPFCGSGTILQEALLLGYKKVIGCDVSERAVADTEKNLEWLFNHPLFPRRGEGRGEGVKIFPCDVRKLSAQVEANSIDAIVTEPYLGPPLKGSESFGQLQKIMDELAQLYLAAFAEFQKVLKPGGKVVIIFPVFVYKNQQKALSAEASALSALKKISADNLIKAPTFSVEASTPSVLKQIGWRKVNREKLIYRRPGQKVEREVLVFEKTSR